MRSKSLTFWVALAAVSCFGLPKARAGIIIQEQTNENRQIFRYSPIGQTFTAEDAHIQSIGFSLEDFNPNFGPIDITIELFEGVGTTGQSLGSATIVGLSPGFSGFYDADFSSVILTVDQVYTAIVSSTSARGGVWVFQWSGATDPYTGGDLIFQGDVLEYSDSTFRIIPEPATLLLLGLGMVLSSRAKYPKAVKRDLV